MNQKISPSEALRLAVRHGEEQSEEIYSAQRVKLSIVHTREDMVTAVYQLSEIVSILKTIKGYLAILVIISALALARYIW